MDIKFYKLIGNVQGVFCRANILSWAKEYKLNGWVRNMDDGSVQVCLQAKSDIHEKAREYFLSGPGRAQVKELEELDLEPSENYTNFVIRPDGSYE